MRMDGWNTCTIAVTVLILITQFLRWCRNCLTLKLSVPPPSAPPIPHPRIPALISDSDLKDLLLDLNDQPQDWESVIHRSNHLCSYSAERTKPKDGPVKYMSTTVFENCSAERLRNFYMDNNYRKVWDKTLIEHQQLYMDVHSGTEVGRTIKKFPFLAPREYILAWKVWEDQRGAFYCLSKGCEHPLAPRQKKYVRVLFHRSGWRIRQVAGRNACEIRMLHQEDAGLNVEMAKLAFAKGIWSYVCRMNDALRTYSPADNVGGMLIQKFPAGLEAAEDDAPNPGRLGCERSKSKSGSVTIPQAEDDAPNPGRLGCERSKSKSGSVTIPQAEDDAPNPGRLGCERSKSKSGSVKLLKNGLILVGGAICLSRGHSNLGAKVAMLCIFTKLTMLTAFKKPTRP